MSVLDTVKTVAGLAKKIGDIELYSQIIDLQSEVYSLIEENHQLRMKMNEADEIKQIEERLQVKGDAYYVDKGGIFDGPFCTACWDKDKILARYHLVESYDDFFSAHCPVCKTSSSYVEKY